MWKRSTNATESVTVFYLSLISFLLKFTALYLRNCPITLLAFPRTLSARLLSCSFFFLFRYTIFSFTFSLSRFPDFPSYIFFTSPIFLSYKNLFSRTMSTHLNNTYISFFPKMIFLCTVTIFLAQLTTFQSIQLQKRMLLMLPSFFTCHNLCQFHGIFCIQQSVKKKLDLRTILR